MSFTVAIVGRPNVGKSTLFNRLIGRRLALVDDQPGVTRDRREGAGRVGDLAFTVIDTAGLEDAHDQSLEARMRIQTEQAVEQADVVLFLIDARAGVTPLDEHFARWLRKARPPVVVVANKCEGRAGEPGLMEAFGLGLGTPVPLSAEHGEGLADLYERLLPFEAAPAPEEAREALAAAPGTAVEPGPDEGEGAEDETVDEIPAGPIRMAVVGRPNVGKSTLINRLLGEDRLLTGPEAGITRDSISVNWTFKDRAIQLIDTAGLRRKAHITDKVEKLSVADTLNAVRFAHVVVLVLDAQQMLEKQDLTIARLVVDEGRALVVAVNKWDLIDQPQAALQRLKDRLETSLPQVKGVPVVTFSALTGASLGRLLPAVLAAYDLWNWRVSTARLNRWLEGVVAAHAPPLTAQGRSQRLRYATMAKGRPPTVIVFASRPEDIPDSYTRYLVNALRQDFDLPGVPIRLRYRKSRNPFVEDKR